MKLRERNLINRRTLFYAGVFLVMFLLTQWTPLIADDYNYKFGYATDSRIEDVRDILSSLSWHRKYLNGRMFSHFFVYLFLMLPSVFFSTANASVMIVFLKVSERFFMDFQGKRPLLLTACLAGLLWICMPAFGEVFLWTAGACNYFWGMTLAWCVLNAVFHIKGKPRKLLPTVFVILPAFIAGAWSEHISFAMLVILFLYLVRLWVVRKRTPMPEICALLAGSGGYLYLMLAPSMLPARLNSYALSASTEHFSAYFSFFPRGILFPLVLVTAVSLLLVLIIKKHLGKQLLLILSRICVVISFVATLYYGIQAFEEDSWQGLISSVQVGFFLPVSLFMALLYPCIKKNESREALAMALFLFFGGICGLGMFLFGAYVPARGFCAMTAFTLLASMLLLGNLPHEQSRRKNRELLLVAAALCGFLTFLLGVQDILTVYKAEQTRQDVFCAAAAGDKIAEVSPLPCRTKYSAQYGLPDLVYDADWPNGIMAEYYDVTRIIVV
ncbi:MAG: DUF6056 family protein, partial [Oscillospiraceae bacterium]|nr:DUF6056 family protein [Oscillospiraceae bacterium]